MASKIPGGNGRVELNRAGMRSLLKSPEIQAELYRRMSKVQAVLPGSELEPMVGRSRARVKVIYGNNFMEAKTGDLSRALDLANGDRGTHIVKK